MRWRVAVLVGIVVLVAGLIVVRTLGGDDRKAPGEADPPAYAVVTKADAVDATVLQDDRLLIAWSYREQRVQRTG